MPAVPRDRKTGLDPYSPFPSSTAKQEGEEIGQAAATLLGMKSATLTAEELAEFDAAVTSELDQFTESQQGGRRRMRGGQTFAEVKQKAHDTWMSILKLVGTPENAGIAIAMVPVGIAKPDLVKYAFSLVRNALELGSRAMTPETVALASSAALIYYYYGDKLTPKPENLSLEIAKTQMEAAIQSAKTSRRASVTLRELADKFKNTLEESKSVPWVPTLEEIEAKAKLEVDTAPSNIGVNAVPKIKSQGQSIGNYSAPPSQFSSTSVKTAPPPPPTKGKFFGGSRRRTKRHRRPSAPTRKRRSSSARRRGDTR
jgi:hypothetical protein